MSRIHIILPWALVGVLLSIFIYRQFIFEPQYKEREHKHRIEYDDNDGYKYIRPILFWDAENGGQTVDAKVVRIEKNVKQIISEAVSGKKIKRISVYFRDLNNGPWFSAGDENLLYPASIYKLPLAVSLYKKEEEEHSFLDKAVKIDHLEFADKSTKYPPPETIEVGKEYTVRELVRRMLSYSDNEAIEPLSELANDEFSRDFFKDMGLLDDSGVRQQLNASMLARFFRVLFNSTFLERDHSEEILKFLADGSFKDGIRKGVPAGIVVASKFGEHGTEGFDTVTLSDCGIVYAKIPYIMCIMTEGNKFSELSEVIAKISKSVYDEVVTVK